MAEGHVPHRAVRRLYSSEQMPTRRHVQANECGKIGQQHRARQRLPPDNNQPFLFAPLRAPAGTTLDADPRRAVAEPGPRHAAVRQCAGCFGCTAAGQRRRPSGRAAQLRHSRHRAGAELRRHHRSGRAAVPHADGVDLADRPGPPVVQVARGHAARRNTARPGVLCARHPAARPDDGSGRHVCGPTLRAQRTGDRRATDPLLRRCTAVDVRRRGAGHLVRARSRPAHLVGRRAHCIAGAGPPSRHHHRTAPGRASAGRRCPTRPAHRSVEPGGSGTHAGRRHAGGKAARPGIRANRDRRLQTAGSCSSAATLPTQHSCRPHVVSRPSRRNPAVSRASAQRTFAWCCPAQTARRHWRACSACKP